MLNEQGVKDAIVELLEVAKTQTELLASTMAELAAVRDAIKPLDPTFDDNFVVRRQAALQRVLPMLSVPIGRIDALVQRIRSGEIL